MSRRLKRRLRYAVTVFLLTMALAIWLTRTEKEAHFSPDYMMEDLTGVLKENRTKEDDILIFRQTGLAPLVVDDLISQGREEEILAQQKYFFAEVNVKCEHNTIVSREERVVKRVGDFDMENIDVVSSVYGESSFSCIPVVEEGDIFITFNAHVLGWRNGHAGIVVDAEKRLILEAAVLGKPSVIVSLQHWETYPSFIVLRLKDVSLEKRKEIAEYAKKHLVNIPYRLSAGIGQQIKETYPFYEKAENKVMQVLENLQGKGWNVGKEEKGKVRTKESGIFPVGKIEEESIWGTQCSHLVWYAYAQFGYDLDSDGGVIVTPRDLYESPYLEVVQIYGINPNEVLNIEEIE